MENEIHLRNTDTCDLFTFPTPEVVRVFMWGRSTGRYEFRVGDLDWTKFQSEDIDEIKTQVKQAVEEAAKCGPVEAWL